MFKKKYRGFPCNFALKSDCEQWLLSNKYDPTKIKLEEAINIIDIEKNKSGYEILKVFGNIKVLKKMIISS